MPTVSDLFTLQYGHSLELNRLELSADSSAVNFVGRAARNNGVTATVKRIPNLSPAKAGTISVSLSGQGGAGVAFLQLRNPIGTTWRNTSRGCRIVPRLSSLRSRRDLAA
jgi:hypothetical protein